MLSSSLLLLSGAAAIQSAIALSASVLVGGTIAAAHSWWLAWRRRLPEGLGELATVCILAILANAFVCGALSNPHDRYGARMVWLATVAAGLALLWLCESRGAAAPNTAGRDKVSA